MEIMHLKSYGYPKYCIVYINFLRSIGIHIPNWPDNLFLVDSVRQLAVGDVVLGVVLAYMTSQT